MGAPSGMLVVNGIVTSPGSFIPVRSVPGGYPLPDGIADGSIVRVVSWDGPYATVDLKGRCFRIFRANIGIRR